jgi:hypothetical protein
LSCICHQIIFFGKHQKCPSPNTKFVQVYLGIRLFRTVWTNVQTFVPNLTLTNDEVSQSRNGQSKREGQNKRKPAFPRRTFVQYKVRPRWESNPRLSAYKESSKLIKIRLFFYFLAFKFINILFSCLFSDLHQFSADRKPVLGLGRDQVHIFA